MAGTCLRAQSAVSNSRSWSPSQKRTAYGKSEHFRCMKKLPKKFFAISAAAVFGCALFVILTIGSIRHNFSLDMSIMIALPVVFVTKVVGLPDNLVNSEPFAIIVNGLLGALLFSLLAVLWQFVFKGNNE